MIINYMLSTKKNNTITIKTSSDNGANWFAEINSFEISSNLINGFDAIFYNNVLHIVWSTKDNEEFFETYYRYYYISNWSSQMQVTDFEWPDKTEGVGGLPSIAVSDVNNVVRVHISFNSGIGTDPADNIGSAATRDFNYSTGTWLDPQMVFNDPPSGSMLEKIIFYGYNLQLFFLDAQLVIKNEEIEITPQWCHIQRSVTVTWDPNNSNIISESVVRYDLKAIPAYTNNNIWYINAVYSALYNGYPTITHNRYGSSGWSNFMHLSGYNPRTFCLGFSKSSNDLYSIWFDESTTSFKYCHYDANPLAPQNFNVSTQGNYAQLSWTANTEPDMRYSGYYKVYRASTAGGVPSTWTYVASVDAFNGTIPVTSWIDPDPWVGSGSLKLYYRLTAVDNNSHESNQSNYDWVSWDGSFQKQGQLDNTITEFKLNENFPNPFNPSTRISYQLPTKCYVTLKVYNVLGGLVSELVNEVKEEGKYYVNFNAADLPSGIYIYTMQATSNSSIIFSQTKNMILIK